jgi:YHS domain-containing protein
MPVFATAVYSQNSQPSAVVEGFESVALIAGKRIKGKPAIYVLQRRSKYLFANAANTSKFEKDPTIYGVHNNGERKFKHGVPGYPDLWKVYKRRTFLCRTSMCKERFQLSLETILHPEKRERVVERSPLD